jgi:hypothetical protein
MRGVGQALSTSNVHVCAYFFFDSHLSTCNTKCKYLMMVKYLTERKGNVNK